MDGKGDLLKFAGDAIFIEWKATQTIDLESCVQAAAKCAANIASKCSDFSVEDTGHIEDPSCVTRHEKINSLNVHCGIGAGQMVGGCDTLAGLNAYDCVRLHAA